MLRSLKEITGCKVSASDGEMGKIIDILFEDRDWCLEYIVVDAGKWFITKPVLISPKKFDILGQDAQTLKAELTKEEIRNSPEISSDPPVALQEKVNIDRQVWIPPGSPVGRPIFPMSESVPKEEGYISGEIASSGNPCLRSVNEVLEYNILAKDGEIGHVEDFIMETGSWTIRYMIIDTRNWLPGGKKVIISPSWIERVEWMQSRVHVNLSCRSIENSPEFDPAAPVNREYESKLYDYYGRSVYWDEP